MADNYDWYDDKPVRPKMLNTEPGSKLFIVLLIACGFAALVMLISAAFER